MDPMTEEGDLVFVHLDSPEAYGGELDNRKSRCQGKRSNNPSLASTAAAPPPLRVSVCSSSQAGNTPEEPAMDAIILSDHPPAEQVGVVSVQTLGHMVGAEGESSCLEPAATPPSLPLPQGGEQGEEGGAAVDEFNLGQEAGSVEGDGGQEKEGRDFLRRRDSMSCHQNPTDGQEEGEMADAAESSFSQKDDAKRIVRERNEEEGESTLKNEEESRRRRITARVDQEKQKEEEDISNKVDLCRQSVGIPEGRFASREYRMAPPAELLRFREGLCRLARADPVAASSLALDAHDTWRVQRAAAEVDHLVRQRKRLLSRLDFPHDGDGEEDQRPAKDKRPKAAISLLRIKREEGSAATPQPPTDRTQQSSRRHEERDEPKKQEILSQRDGNPASTISGPICIEGRDVAGSFRCEEEVETRRGCGSVEDHYRHEDDDELSGKQRERGGEEEKEDTRDEDDLVTKGGLEEDDGAEDRGEGLGDECPSDYYDSDCDSMYAEVPDLHPEDEQVQKHLLGGGPSAFNGEATPGGDFMSLVDAWRSIQQLCRSGEGSGSEGPSGNGMAHLSEEERRALRSQLYKQLAPQSWNDSVEYYCAVCNSAKEEGDAAPMLVCEGYCQRVFHPKCVGLEALSFDLTTQTAVSSSHPGGGALGAERAFSFHCEDCCDEVIKCSCCGLRKPRRQVARCSHMLCRRFFCWPSCVEKIPHISPFQPGPLVPSPAPPEVVECLVRRRGGKCAASLSKELRRLHLCQQPSLQAEASVSPTEKEKAEKGQQRAGAQRQEEAGHKAISSEGKDSRDDDGRKSRGRPQQQPQQIGRPALERRPSRGGDDCCDGALPVTNSIVGKGSVPVDRRQKPQAETLHPSKGFLSGSSASDLNSSRLVEAARTLYDAGEEVFFDAQGRERFICARHFCTSCYALECQHFTWETQLRQIAQLADDLYMPLPTFFNRGGGGRKRTVGNLGHATTPSDDGESQVDSPVVAGLVTPEPSTGDKNGGKGEGTRANEKKKKKSTTGTSPEEQNAGATQDNPSPSSQGSRATTVSPAADTSPACPRRRGQKDEAADERVSPSSSSSALVSCSSSLSCSLENEMQALEQRIAFARACFEFAKEATKGWTDKRIFSKQYKPLRPDPFPNLLVSPLVDIWECHSCSASFCGRCVPPASKILNDALGSILCDFCRASEYAAKRDGGRFERRGGRLLSDNTGHSGTRALERRRRQSKKRKGRQKRTEPGFISDGLVSTIVDGAECVTSLTNNMLRQLHSSSSLGGDEGDDYDTLHNAPRPPPVVSLIERSVWEACELEEDHRSCTAGLLEEGGDGRRRGHEDFLSCSSRSDGLDPSSAVQETCAASSADSRRRSGSRSRNTSGRTPNGRHVRCRKRERDEKEDGEGSSSTNEQEDDEASDGDDEEGTGREENANHAHPGGAQYKRKHLSSKQQRRGRALPQEQSTARASSSSVSPSSSSVSATSSLDNRLNFQFITSCVYPAHCRNLLRAPRTEGFNEVCVCSGDRCEGDCLNRSRGIQCDRRRCRFGAMDCGNRQFKRVGGGGGGGGSNGNGATATCGYNLCYVKECGPEKGLGVFAREKIDEGKLVVEYVGEVLDSQLLALRMRAYSEQELRKGKKQHWYVMEVMPHVYIDSTRVGNIARLVNHSCEPNCTLQRVSVHGTYRMGIFALRPILPGEEISYDYGFTRKGFGQGFICFCGSSRCRGRIGGDSRRNKFVSVADNCLKRKEGFDHLLCRQLCQALTSQNFSRAERIPPPSPYTWRRDGISTSAQAREWLEKRLLEAELSNPFFAQFIFDFHLYDASVNFVKLLLLDGKTVEEYARSKTKTLCMDIPWSLLASDLNDKVLVQTTRHSILTEERLNKAKKFFLSNMAIRAAAVSGRSAQTALQDLVDLNWGSTEMCSLCDSEGVVSVCDACAEAYHSDCAELSQDDQGRSLCPACLLSDSRRQWHLMNEAERTHVAVRLNALRLLETLAGSAYQQEYRLARRQEMGPMLMAMVDGPGKTDMTTVAAYAGGGMTTHSSSNGHEAREETTAPALQPGRALASSQSVGGGLGKLGGTARHHAHGQTPSEGRFSRPVLAGMHVDDIWDAFTLQEEDEALFFEVGYIED